MVIKRSTSGFGFTVAGTGPVVVGRVQSDSAASRAGLLQGDRVIRLNGQNVSSMPSETVAKMIRSSSNVVVIDIHRKGEHVYENIQEKKQSQRYVCNKLNILFRKGYF